MQPTHTVSFVHQVLARLLKEKLSMMALLVIVGYALVALLVHWNILGSSWSVPVGASYEAPNSQHWLGTDIFGRSVAAKVVKSTAIAMNVGCIVSLIAIVLGVTLGSLAGYFGGIVDEIVVWIYTTLASIPNIMLLISLAFVLGKGKLAIYTALGMTNWIDLCRLVRSEVMRHKDREYVQAATTIGAGHLRKLFRHILPNVFHIVIVQLSAIFQSAIKSEVILSYLGLGIQNSPSWGAMISDAKSEMLAGVWWQLAFSTGAMFFIVLAFNILTDALRDALDPKLRGK
jgi:ABC-type dipeptide/oligopeptide/nickel transport system permease subunit